MAIRITVIAGSFHVELTPPEGDWQTADALSVTEVTAELAQLGCHQMDVFYALDESGTDWRALHDAEVLRRRPGDS